MSERNHLTTRQLFEATQERLQLRWIAGLGGGDRTLHRETKRGNRPTLVAHLNLIRPSRVQVLGTAELAYMERYGLEPNDHSMQQLFQPECNIVLLTAGLHTPQAFCQLADERNVALFESDLHSHELIAELSHYLSQELADRITLHGVMMDVLGIGVLITGDSSVGKSELALELVSRGSSLVADDAPEFTRIAPHTLEGASNPILQDLLEVRGLGILNVREMYGDAATRRRKILKLIVRLEEMNSDSARSINRLDGSNQVRTILNVDIAQTTIPVAPGRNMSVLVEAAVRNYLLMQTGYNPTEDLIQRQSRAMAQQKKR